MLMGLVLGLFWYWMAESGSWLFHILWHGQVCFVVPVVPVHCDFQESPTFPVFFNFVVLLENADEMCDMFLSNVLNAKIVYN